MSKGAIFQYNGQAVGTPTGVYAVENLTPENIKKGVNIGGIDGTLETATQGWYRGYISGNGSSSLVINDIEHIPTWISIGINNYPTASMQIISATNSSGGTPTISLNVVANGYSGAITGTAVFDSVNKTLTITSPMGTFNSGRSYRYIIAYDIL